MRIPPLIVALVILFPATGRSEPVRFNRDVLPILADTCFACHGPEAAKRKGKLRLDQEKDARRVLGKVEASELVRRITAADADERMPPKGSGRELTSAQVDTLRRWVAEGAVWEKHWA